MTGNLKNTMRLFFLLPFLLLMSNSYAMTVKVVYRADIRPPEEVFNSGFTAWGTNVNYYAHILGLSGAMGSRNSAFMPTTSNIDIATEFARERAIATGQTYYVYTIRATDNMYPALESVYAMYDAHNTRVSDDVRVTVAREQEYSAYSSISSQQVRTVESYRFTDGEWITYSQSNPNYAEADTHSHDGPYPGSASSPIGPQPRLLVGSMGIGADFVPEEDAEQNDSAAYCFGCLAPF